MINYSNERAFGSSHSTALTPSQRLAAIEHSRSVRRGRTKATAKVFGIVSLIFVSCLLVTQGGGEFLGGAVLIGVVLAVTAIWSGAFDNSNRNGELASRTEIDPRVLKDLDQRLAHLETLDQRLANLETIASYEEKVAARNRRVEGAQD
jgi:hypothetical protein